MKGIWTILTLALLIACSEHKESESLITRVSSFEIIETQQSNTRDTIFFTSDTSVSFIKASLNLYNDGRFNFWSWPFGSCWPGPWDREGQWKVIGDTLVLNHTPDTFQWNEDSTTINSGLTAYIMDDKKLKLLVGKEYDNRLDVPKFIWIGDVHSYIKRIEEAWTDTSYATLNSEESRAKKCLENWEYGTFQDKLEITLIKQDSRIKYQHIRIPNLFIGSNPKGQTIGIIDYDTTKEFEQGTLLRFSPGKRPEPFHEQLDIPKLRVYEKSKHNDLYCEITKIYYGKMIVEP